MELEYKAAHCSSTKDLIQKQSVGIKRLLFSPSAMMAPCISEACYTCRRVSEG